MTFLELVQRLSDESGVGGGATVSAVTGQTGRAAKFVRWVSDAWRDVQNEEGAWRWMEADFSGPTVAGDKDYTPANLGISTRFGEWIYGDNEFAAPVTIYETVAEEGRLIYVPWPYWRSVYGIGVPPSGKPSLYTVAPDNQIHLYGTPDAAYTVRGTYRKAPQTLTANGDVPEMPERFHDIIVDRALDYVAADDASEQVVIWGSRVLRKMVALRRDQLPRVTLGGPLA